MVIVEFPNFTKAITTLMSDDEYRQLQVALVENPTLGKLLQGAGGLRKLRWSLLRTREKVWRANHLLLVGMSQATVYAGGVSQERAG